MRVWDLNPGYLDRQRLLGEHVEIHAAYSILKNGFDGYSAHPEVIRWKGRLAALWLRHALVAAEMDIRGYNHNSPLPDPEGKAVWPEVYVTPPHKQIMLLAEKFGGLHGGRIPLPANPYQLWAQYKYSVMARDVDLYRSIGKAVAARKEPMIRLVEKLVETMRQKPSPGMAQNALSHMWSHVKRFSSLDRQPENPAVLLENVIILAMAHDVDYIKHSTALSDLRIWIDKAKKSPVEEDAA